MLIDEDSMFAGITPLAAVSKSAQNLQWRKLLIVFFFMDNKSFLFFFSNCLLACVSDRLQHIIVSLYYAFL